MSFWCDLLYGFKTLLIINYYENKSNAVSLGVSEINLTKAVNFPSCYLWLLNGKVFLVDINSYISNKQKTKSIAVANYR